MFDFANLKILLYEARLKILLRIDAIKDYITSYILYPISDNGYTVIDRNNEYYLSYEELWEL